MQTFGQRSGFNNSVLKFVNDIEFALNAEPESLDDFKMFSKITENCQSCKVYRIKWSIIWQ